MAGSISVLQHLSILLFISAHFNYIGFVRAAAAAGITTNPNDVAALKSLQSSWSSTWDLSKDPCSSSLLGINCTTYPDTSTGTDVYYVTQIILINQDLQGTLSSAIGDLIYLKAFDVSSNPKLGGELPPEIGQLKYIERFYVQFCGFNGSIPTDIGNMTSLQYLGMSSNGFTGTIPETVGYLTNLTWLDLSYNYIGGYLPMSSTTSTQVGLDNLTIAQHLHLQGNRLIGEIPYFGKGMHIQHLLLAENLFTGNIPESISNFEDLDIIRLDSNNLNGTIPSSISALVHLASLNLSSNNLTGEIPTFSNVNLSMIILSNNQLNGTLNLTSYNNLKDLTLVDVSNNNITEVDQGSYSKTLRLYGNPYCSAAQSNSDCKDTGETTSLSSTDNINGCPACSKYYRVNPKANSSCTCVKPIVATWSFYGLKIPSLYNLTEANLTGLETDFLAMWKAKTFTDYIQLEFTQLVFDVVDWQTMNISVFPPNGSSLWTPASKASSIQYALSNQDIWFPEIGPMGCAFNLPPYSTTTTVVIHALSLAAKIGIAVGAAVAVIIILGLLYYVLRLRRRINQAEKVNRPFAAWIAHSKGEEGTNVPQLKGARWFSLEEIHKYTNYFSRNNEIGEGGYGKVYKGYLPSGECVAIKRSSSSSLQGAAEFKNEIELLSRVHHRNLVGLIGFCFEEGEQMLVYQYMPNGTLRECLEGKSGINMDWETRIDLAVGAARGLAYLHNEANPPIIHRDIKSNNILLDDKLVATVADFGLSKLAPSEGEEAQSINVKGTLGYLDPNYYLTNQFTEKSDVYSFGVVLFELMTGRKPIQGGRYIVRDIETSFRKGGMDLLVETLLDPTLKDYPMKDMERLLDLAMSCVRDEPMERPTMIEVVKELEEIAHPTMKPKSFDIKQEPKTLDDERAELYNKAFPFLQESYGSSSFDYSGSYSSYVKKPLFPQ